MGAARAHHENLAERYRAFGRPSPPIVSSSGAVSIMHGHFGGFEGEAPGLPCAVLGLCTHGGGRAFKKGPGFSVDDVWRPGRVGLALPNQPASGASPPMGMLGIAFDPTDIPACHGAGIDGASLARVANRIFDDSLTAWIMTALWRDAEAHGASSAFFDHGLSLLLQRLLSLAGSAEKLPSGPLHGPLADVFAVIETRFGEDLRVDELAAIAGVDSRTLTRTFKRETGSTPFAYLTARRMDHAKTLLRDGTPVTETALTVGYGNPAKFSAAFRRWVGTSPSAWRRGAR